MKAVAYDRACEFVPFLKNLSKKTNIGANTLLDNVKFMVDIFHCRKHTSKTCMPPPDKNPHCKYHPACSEFEQFKDVNTEIAESVFSWIKSHKRNVHMMGQHKFAFYVEFVVKT